MIINGDSQDVLQTLEPNSIDLVVTDPPYGYSFMGKDWDKAVPSVEIWKECLRVLKPGAFCFVMSAPRSDVQNAMISRLMEAGFRLDFTPIYWTYASGFPKAGNVGKLVDKRLGAEREVVRMRTDGNKGGGAGTYDDDAYVWDKPFAETKASSPAAKALDGSYAGFQPKPAVEVIIVAMKPLSEKTYVDQAMKNGKGITWLDDCRVPTGDPTAEPNYRPNANNHNRDDGKHDPSAYKYGNESTSTAWLTQGRFPANLLVSDDVLNDGVERKGNGRFPKYVDKSNEQIYGKYNNIEQEERNLTDSGSYSRYFDLDKWASTLPFLIVPKASKSEKNKGLDGFPEKPGGTNHTGEGGGTMLTGSGNPRSTLRKNFHPTVKPLKLMSYLITLGSREGDTVLDPFVGSGTTVVAAKQLGRKGIGIEREEEYTKIAQARVEAVNVPAL